MGHAGPINTQNLLVVLSKPVGIVRLLPPLKTTAPKDGTGTESWAHTPTHPLAHPVHEHCGGANSRSQKNGLQILYHLRYLFAMAPCTFSLGPITSSGRSWQILAL